MIGPEAHLAAYHRLLDATKEVQDRARKEPVSFAQLHKIAEKYSIQTPGLLSHIEIDPDFYIDYDAGVIKCLLI